jgi:hypothetical protein
MTLNHAKCRVDGIEHARAVRKPPVLQLRQNDPTGPEIALLIQFTAVHHLAAIFRDVAGQTMRALHAKTKRMRITHIRFPHLLAICTKAYHTLPDRAQQGVALATAHGNMEMQRAPSLFFYDGHIVEFLHFALGITLLL